MSIDHPIDQYVEGARLPRLRADALRKSSSRMALAGAEPEVRTSRAATQEYPGCHTTQ